jgi:ribonuclease HI
MSNPTPTKSNQSATVRSTPAEKKPVDPEQVARSVAAIKKMLRDN